jgi:hypothetical protein
MRVHSGRPCLAIHRDYPWKFDDPHRCCVTVTRAYRGRGQPRVMAPLPTPLTRGNIMEYANSILFDVTGHTCMRSDLDQDVTFADWDGMAARLGSATGLLDDGVSFVGPLAAALAAFGLEPTVIEFPDIAYGLGQVPAAQALPHLPEGTWWVPALRAFKLADGRGGWYLSGEWFASPSDCGEGF